MAPRASASTLAGSSSAPAPVAPGAQMDQMDQNGERGEGGNTTAPSPLTEPEHDRSQTRYWAATWFYRPEDQMDQVMEIFKHECTWYICQEEKCPTTGRLHLQCQFCFKTKQRFTELRRYSKDFSWRKTRSIVASSSYCEKQRTRCGRQWIHGLTGIPEEIETDQPYGWQLEIMDLIKTKPDKRTIHWYWEPNGNVGKSSLCKHLVVHHKALILSGKSNDMFHMLSKFPDKRGLIIYDVPRTAFEYINYTAIESIKNGLICSGKYERAQIVFNSPHLIVFANSPPNTAALSQDRWHIVEIHA